MLRARASRHRREASERSRNRFLARGRHKAVDDFQEPGQREPDVVAGVGAQREHIEPAPKHELPRREDHRGHDRGECAAECRSVAPRGARGARPRRDPIRRAESCRFPWSERPVQAPPPRARNARDVPRKQTSEYERDLGELHQVEADRVDEARVRGEEQAPSPAVFRARGRYELRGNRRRRAPGR